MFLLAVSSNNFRPQNTRTNRWKQTFYAGPARVVGDRALNRALAKAAPACFHSRLDAGPKKTKDNKTDRNKLTNFLR